MTKNGCSWKWSQGVVMERKRKSRSKEKSLETKKRKSILETYVPGKTFIWYWIDDIILD